MPRKVLDIVPIITARFIGAGTVTTEEGARAQVEDAIAALGKDFECTVAFDVDDRCSFCNSPWTEAGSDHNASCCPQDDANNPERLKTIAELAAAGADTTKLQSLSDLIDQGQGAVAAEIAKFTPPASAAPAGADPSTQAGSTAQAAS